MLLRMYLRWCERKGYKTEMLDQQPGEEAGIKSVSVHRRGRLGVRLSARGERRAPAGAHLAVRRQRAPPDRVRRRRSSTRISTTTIEIEIRDEDLEVQTFRSGGAGGQHVNKTESAVRIIHMPIGHRRRVPDGALAAQEPLDAR